MTIDLDRRITLNTDTQAYRILELIAVSGEVPFSLIRRLPGGNRYKETVIVDLKEKKLIHTYHKDGVRGYRLNSKAKELLLSVNRNRFDFFLTGNIETNKLKSEITRRLRLHNISEIIVTMQNAGVLVHRDEKLRIFFPGSDETVINDYITVPSFFSSREINEYGADSVKCKGARTVGSLLTRDKIYVVYNTGNCLMKWGYATEQRTKGLMKGLLCHGRMRHQYREDSVFGLMFGKDMNTAYELLISSGGKKKKSFFKLNNDYPCFHYLPNDYCGELLLRLLCDTEKMETLNRILSEDLNEHDPHAGIENDAIDKNGTPVLFAYSFDMQRIVRFYEIIQIQNRTGIIICFDFQEDVLKRFCKKNVSFQAINLKKFEGRFFA